MNVRNKKAERYTNTCFFKRFLMIRKLFTAHSIHLHQNGHIFADIIYVQDRKQETTLAYIKRSSFNAVTVKLMFFQKLHAVFSQVSPLSALFINS